MRDLTLQEIENVEGGIAAAPAGAIAGAIVGGIGYVAGGGRDAAGFATAAVYGAIGGAMTASGAGLAMQLFGGGVGAFGGWLSIK